MKGALLNSEDLDILVRRESGLIVGGLVIDDATYQNIDLVVSANKGDFKEFPTLGVGAERYLKSVRREGLRREVALQLETIGYRAQVKVSENGELEINV